MVTKISGSHWLADAAAASWLRMVAAGMPNQATSAGRSRAEQQATYDQWKAGKMPGTPTVAKPGTSRHETGRAIDVPEPTRAWLHRTGAEYGWTNPAWAKRAATLEPWHFEYDPTQDRHRDDQTTTSSAVLRRGSKGAAVKALQAAMRKAFPGYARTRGALAVDGDFGSTTEAWVREFQRRVGISADGIVGDETRRTLGRYGVTF